MSSRLEDIESIFKQFSSSKEINVNLISMGRSRCFRGSDSFALVWLAFLSSELELQDPMEPSLSRRCCPALNLKICAFVVTITWSDRSRHQI